MKHNINPKLITSVAMLLALVSAPAFGGIVCTDPTAPCISISAPLVNVLEFKGGQAGNKLEVLTLDPGGFQGMATYTPSMASGGSPDTGGTAVFGGMDFITTGSLTTPPPPNPDASVPLALQNSPYFSAAGPEKFTYQALDLDLLKMDITWTSLLPNPPLNPGDPLPEPQLFGTGKMSWTPEMRQLAKVEPCP